MSRGPGRIERTLQQMLCEHPHTAFTADELVVACFPDEHQILKKHRVSVLRSLRKVGDAAGWVSEFISGQRGTFVLYNPTNLHSYAVGRTRAREQGDWSRTSARCAVISAEKAESMLMGLDTPTYWRKARDESRWVRTDGPYPVAVARWVARNSGNDAEAEKLWEEFQIRIKTAVFLPKTIVGEIHPDFLKDRVRANPSQETLCARH